MGGSASAHEPVSTLGTQAQLLGQNIKRQQGISRRACPRLPATPRRACVSSSLCGGRTPDGHTVSCVACRPDGQLAACAAGKTVHLFEPGAEDVEATR